MSDGFIDIHASGLKKYENPTLLPTLKRDQPYFHKLLQWNTKNGAHLALTGSTGQPSTRLKPLSFLLSSVSWKTDYFFVWIFPPWDLEKLQHTRVNILDLKILQVFFKNRGEILVFEKMLNFLSFLVLLYVSGHSKQKKFLKFFWLIE